LVGSVTAATASGPGERAFRSAKLATRYVAAAAEQAARANSRRAFDAMPNDERIMVANRAGVLLPPSIQKESD
jgi:hydroxyethylthiazole kinase-like sugar kinase family protein